jgi:hypothetical protein
METKSRFEGKSLNTTFEIAEAARECKSAGDAAELAKACPGVDVGVIVNALCKGDPCAAFFSSKAGPTTRGE